MPCRSHVHTYHTCSTYHIMPRICHNMFVFGVKIIKHDQIYVYSDAFVRFMMLYIVTVGTVISSNMLYHVITVI